MKKQVYRVRENRTFGVRNEFKAGAKVQLTAEEAAPFLDKLILIGESKAPNPDLKNDLGIEAAPLIPDPEDEAGDDDGESLIDLTQETKPKPKTTRKPRTKKGKAE